MPFAGHSVVVVEPRATVHGNDGRVLAALCRRIEPAFEGDAVSARKGNLQQLGGSRRYRLKGRGRARKRHRKRHTNRAPGGGEKDRASKHGGAPCLLRLR